MRGLRTVTVTIFEGEVPPLPVQTIWYEEVPEGLTGIPAEFEIAPPVEKALPTAVHEVALVEPHESSEDWPTLMVLGPAESQAVGAHA